MLKSETKKYMKKWNIISAIDWLSYILCGVFIGVILCRLSVHLTPTYNSIYQPTDTDKETFIYRYTTVKDYGGL